MCTLTAAVPGVPAGPVGPAGPVAPVSPFVPAGPGAPVAPVLPFAYDASRFAKVWWKHASLVEERASRLGGLIWTS